MSWKLIKVGDRIQINAFSHKGQKGYVRFRGEVEGFVGEMLGIELDEPNGKDVGSYFHCQEGHGIFFRSAQVKNIPDENKDVKKTAAKGLKKPAGGLKKPGAVSKSSETASKDESKDESETVSEDIQTPRQETTRQTEKFAPPKLAGITKGGLKGPSTRSTMVGHKDEPESSTGGESARTSKVSKLKGAAASKLGLKKPAAATAADAATDNAKKPEAAKSLAQKKEDIKNKVKAKKLEAAGAKGEEKKTAIKKFSKPAKPVPSKVEKQPSETKDHHDDIDDAAVAKLEASLKHENSGTHEEEKKLKPAGFGLK